MWTQGKFELLFTVSLKRTKANEEDRVEDRQKKEGKQRIKSHDDCTGCSRCYHSQRLCRHRYRVLLYAPTSPSPSFVSPSFFLHMKECSFPSVQNTFFKNRFQWDLSCTLYIFVHFLCWMCMFYVRANSRRVIYASFIWRLVGFVSVVFTGKYWPDILFFVSLMMQAMRLTG